MLEPCINQAAGLQALAPQLMPKLVAVVSHGQQQGELPMLWSLCTSWVDMGQSVIVLDGHKAETDHNPGLWHLLSDTMSHFSADQEAASWTIMPAALGFEQLATSGFNSKTVGHLFQNYGIVLLYADATKLTCLLKDSTLTPLLVVAPLKSSSLSAYQALKELLLDAHLHPTVANIALPPKTTTAMSSPVQNLQNCAMAFLGLKIKPITVSAMAHADGSQGEINRLALQLLESAVILERQPIKRTH
ncbi:MAG: hypothetical protein FD135_2585 [Comamonadaceae bacterium]|nr:MAG: hypothetical protein FD135_2585 [Comamonadaceae bacterium]